MSPSYDIGDQVQVDLDGEDHAGQVMGRYSHAGVDHVLVCIYMVVDHIDFLIPVSRVKALLKRYAGRLTELSSSDLLGKHVAYHPGKAIGQVVHVFPRYRELSEVAVYVLADPLNVREAIILRNQYQVKAIKDPS